MYEWENSDQENNEEDAENEGVLTNEQHKLKQVLAQKGKQIVMAGGKGMKSGGYC
jgi:hypothetical protein